MPLPRARVVTLNAALGPLDYRVPDGMAVEPGSVVVAPLGPRQLVGVGVGGRAAGDARKSATTACARSPGWSTCRRSPAPLRRLAEWTADYYLSPLAARAADGAAVVVGAGRAAVD